MKRNREMSYISISSADEETANFLGFVKGHYSNNKLFLSNKRVIFTNSEIWMKVDLPFYHKQLEKYFGLEGLKRGEMYYLERKWYFNDVYTYKTIKPNNIDDLVQQMFSFNKENCSLLHNHGLHRTIKINDKEEDFTLLRGKEIRESSFVLVNRNDLSYALEKERNKFTSPSIYLKKREKDIPLVLLGEGGIHDPTDNSDEDIDFVILPSLVTLNLDKGWPVESSIFSYPLNSIKPIVKEEHKLSDSN